jgi:hypothetical protein
LLAPQAILLQFRETARYGLMSGIFVSYRQDDSASAAGRLFDRLAAHFGKEQVFFDVDTMAPGAELGITIDQSIARSTAFIAVIGKGWLEARATDGRRRLDKPDDYVRAEIRTALRQGKTIIPVLIDGARLPDSKDLPEDIAALTSRLAIDVSETRFDFDVSRIVCAVEGIGN